MALIVIVLWTRRLHREWRSDGSAAIYEPSPTSMGKEGALFWSKVQLSVVSDSYYDWTRNGLLQCDRCEGSGLDKGVVRDSVLCVSLYIATLTQ